MTPSMTTSRRALQAIPGKWGKSTKLTLSMTTSRRVFKVLGNVVLVLMLLWTAIPFYWMIATSLKHEKEIYGYDATLIPQQPTLANYVTVFRETPYLLFLRNSMVVAVSSTLLSMFIACLGAYAIARLNFPGRAFLARSLVFTYLVPTSLLFIPMFAMMSALHLTDSLHGLTIAYLGFDVPFCTWLLMGYFKSVPVELEEAALVDGCNRVTALVRVVLPLALPALVVVTFFSFTHAWNEFLYAHVFTSTNSARTVTTGLANFMSQDVFFWGPLMASTIMSALPPVLMFLVLQRWVVQGLTLGGVRG
jgi:multiple sugar transport system permease protein